MVELPLPRPSFFRSEGRQEIAQLLNPELFLAFYPGSLKTTHSNLYKWFYIQETQYVLTCCFNWRSIHDWPDDEYLVCASIFRQMWPHVKVHTRTKCTCGKAEEAETRLFPVPYVRFTSFFWEMQWATGTFLLPSREVPGTKSTRKYSGMHVGHFECFTVFFEERKKSLCENQQSLTSLCVKHSAKCKANII